MDKLPFSVYDFFGYLASGFVLLVGVAAAFTNNDNWQSDPSLIVGLLLVILAYTSGHVVANVAGFLLEATFARRVLKSPTVNLFSPAATGRWRYIFPGYYKPLPEAQRTRVLSRAAAAGITLPSEGLFFHCFATVKAREDVMSRLNTFLNLYGYCRNMCLTLLAVAVALGVGTAWTHTARTGQVAPGWWAVGAALAAVGLLFRYLKFYRLYAVEVYINYAESHQ
jgi:hypothetical protein